jgi:Protein of unknown function (DUF4239)
VEILTSSSLWVAGLVLVGLSTAVAMSGTILVRRWFTLSQLRLNNEVAGFKFATVGVLYAVLLAFAVVVVWEKFSEAEDQVATEAGAVATLYRLWPGMAAESPALHEKTSDYVRVVIEEDWPAMAAGRISEIPTRALTDLYAAVLRFRPVEPGSSEVLYEALYQLDQVTQARRARLVMASGVVPGVLWIVLFMGAVVTVGFTFFFGSENLKAQAMMTGALSLLIFSGLLVIVAIDRPFSGAVVVGPEPLIEVLEEFGERAQR